MEYKIVTSEDEQAVKQLWHYCFEKSYDPFFKWYFAHYYQKSNTLGCYDQDKLAACLQLIPYTLFLRGQETSVSYVVGVSTYPEERGTGAVRNLLQAGLVEMRKRGQYASILMPSKAEFYYPHQWELCYHRYKYSVAMSSLSEISGKWGKFSPYQGEEDIAKFHAVYKEFVRSKHAYVVRSRENWQHLIASFGVEEGYSYLLEHDGQPAGYILYTLQDRKFIIREMAYISQTAQKALLRFVYNHRSQADQVEWYAPHDDLLYFRLPDPKKEVILYPFMSARIVDVEKALKSLQFPTFLSCHFSLAVQDSLANWNHRGYDITIAGGEVLVNSIDAACCEVACNIGAFSQLFFGRLNATELAYREVLNGKVQTIELLDQLFPKCCNYINEYF